MTMNEILRKAEAIVKTIMTPVSNNVYLFVALVLFSATLMMLSMIETEEQIDLCKILIALIFESYIVCLLAWVLEKVYMRWFVWVVSIAFLYVELFTLFFHHSLYNIHVVQLLTDTDARESVEFVTSALSSSAFLYTLMITIGILVVGFVISKYFKILCKKVQMVKRISICVSLVLVVISAVIQYDAYVRLKKCFDYEYLGNFITYEDEKPSQDTPAVRFLYGLSFKYVVLKDLKNIETSVEQTKVDGCSYKCPLIVLVIGESYDKAHSHVYNPSYLETTPQLSALKESGNLFLFDNAITSYNHTTEAFKEMFSTFSFDGTDDWTNHSLFTAVFKKAGYDVYFLSNQFASDFDDIWNHFGGTLFNNRKLSELQFTYRNRNVYPFDGELIEEIPDIEVLKSRPTLVVVHFIGQHVDYALRYPEEFRKFTPDDVNPQYGGEIGKHVVANYDNSLLYNDYVVGSIMQKVSGTDAICIYMADHGEEVYDWRDAYMRTDESELLPEVAHYQFEIPFMVYLSDEFKANHEDLAKKISESVDLKIMNKDLSHILLNLGGIETPEYNAKYDCFSDEYDNDKKRIVRGSCDFDEVIKGFKAK